MNKLIKRMWEYLCFTMILIGIVGLSWSAFSEHGWIERLWGVAWDAEMRHPILATPIVIGTILLVWLFMRGGLEAGKVHLLDGILIYAIMLVGLYFTLKFFYSGAWPF